MRNIYTITISERSDELGPFYFKIVKTANPPELDRDMQIACKGEDLQNLIRMLAHVLQYDSNPEFKEKWDALIKESIDNGSLKLEGK